MALLSALSGILQRPTIVDILGELAMFIAPLWVAVIVGVLVGWTWKPKWANLGRGIVDSVEANDTTAVSHPSSSSCFAFIPYVNTLKFQLPSCIPWPPTSEVANEPAFSDCRFVVSLGFSIYNALKFASIR